MNIRGIEMLRELGLPGPRRERIHKDFEGFDLDYLYEGADLGGTIMCFDYSEPINMNPLVQRRDGKSVRKYKITKDRFVTEFMKLVDKMRIKGVSDVDNVIVTHHTYSPDNIAYSGRGRVLLNHDGFGTIWIDAVRGLRKGENEFDPECTYEVPIVGGRVRRSEAKFTKNEFELPERYLDQMVRDLFRTPGNPNIDFEVYVDDGKLFYHDMFLDY